MNNYVVITIDKNEQDYVLLITIPEVNRRVSVGEAILNLDIIFDGQDHIECHGAGLETIKLEFDDTAIPKASQICMWAKSVVILDEIEYQDMMQTISAENGVSYTIN